MSTPLSNDRPPSDQALVDIADYVTGPISFSPEAYTTARHCLMDSLGCALLALKFPECVKHLGPIVPGATLPNGARVPGTAFQLDPVQAAFNIGCMIRWLDFNDTWLAAEWGHPSDNLGGILAVADYLCRSSAASLNMRDILAAMIQAHEIQGVLALQNSFNRIGLDHVILVKIASTAVVTRMLGGTKPQIIDALSHAFVDGHPLRTYRHAPNTGPRKSWAAGDATARAVRLALMVMKGEMGIPSVLTAPRWGFQDVFLHGKPLQIERPYGCYVMENVLFKISFPAEFHAQSAVEAAIMLHPQVIHRLEEIRSIKIWTHESALRIICKDGPLSNPADRDHCLQYMVAVALLHGNLVAEHYENASHNDDPRIDRLRALMAVQEEPSFSRDYLDPQKRSIANAMQITFADGSSTEKLQVEYPLGHRRRRAEGIGALERKFMSNLQTRFAPEHCRRIAEICMDQRRLEQMAVGQFLDLLVAN